MLTLQQLKNMPPDTIFATGVVANHPNDIYLVNHRIGDEMVWVAQRGGYHDWAIYVNWKGADPLQGNKILTQEYIKQLVPCDDEAFSMYRY